MKNLKIFFLILGVALLAACGGTKDHSSKKGIGVENDSLAEYDGPNDIALENEWIANTRDAMKKLFADMNMTAKQASRFEVEFRNSSTLWRKENPGKVRTLDERRATRDKLMYRILSHDQMDIYVQWTQEIEEKE